MAGVCIGFTNKKLVLYFAVLCVIIIIYIYLVDMYITGTISSVENGFVAYVYPNQDDHLNISGKSNYTHTVTVQTNASGRGGTNASDDLMIPGHNAWIPYPVMRNPAGPFILRTKSGETIKYTNYTFYPLTFNSRFLINSPNVCKDTDDLTFLIMVHTYVLNFDRRKALRETWANPRLLHKHPARIVFLVGKTKSNTSQKAIEIESEKFKDIIQGDFIDDYHNLTHKGILGYRWIVTYCKNAKFILKIDDDVFVNIFLVIRDLLPKYQEGKRIITCRFITHADIDRKGKYAVDPDYFPGYKRSPLQYCTGAFVLMLSTIVPEMYEAAKSIPFYWVDDFYLFGLLPNQLSNISFHFVGNVDNSEANALKCFLGDQPCEYLAAYAWSNGVMYKYWNATLLMYKDLVQDVQWK